MQTKPLPVIEESDLKAARNFLTSLRQDDPKDRAPMALRDPETGVTVRNGITRARFRTGAKTTV